MWESAAPVCDRGLCDTSSTSGAGTPSNCQITMFAYEAPQKHITKSRAAESGAKHGFG